MREEQNSEGIRARASGNEQVRISRNIQKRNLFLHSPGDHGRDAKTRKKEAWYAIARAHHPDTIMMIVDAFDVRVKKSKGG